MDAKTVKICFNRESLIFGISLCCICMGIENLLVHVLVTRTCLSLYIRLNLLRVQNYKLRLKKPSMFVE